MCTLIEDSQPVEESPEATPAIPPSPTGWQIAPLSARLEGNELQGEIQELLQEITARERRERHGGQAQPKAKVAPSHKSRGSKNEPTEIGFHTVQSQAEIDAFFDRCRRASSAHCSGSDTDTSDEAATDPTSEVESNAEKLASPTLILGQSPRRSFSDAGVSPLHIDFLDCEESGEESGEEPNSQSDQDFTAMVAHLYLYSHL